MPYSFVLEPVRAPQSRGLAVLTGLVLLFTSSLTLAHEGTGVAGGLISGFLHPISGLDHLVAMVAVGLWGVFLRQPAIWLLPIIFPVVMALGAALGVAGVPVPAVETGIAASALVLGVLVALAARPPLWLAGLIVGLFAIFHGHAHGTELPEAANPLAYSLGFVVSTGLLHLAGILLGQLMRWPSGTLLVRCAGGVIGLIGIGFLTGYL